MDNTTKMLGGIGYIVLIVFGFLGGIMAPLNIITLAAAICVLIAFIRASNELGRPELNDYGLKVHRLFSERLKVVSCQMQCIAPR